MSERIYSIVLDTVVAVVFESLVKLEFEGVEPKSDDWRNIDVEHLGQLHQAVLLRGRRLHQLDFVGETQVEPEGASSDQQVRPNERLNSQNEQEWEVVAN